MLWIKSHTKYAVNNGQLSSMNVLQVVCQKPHGAKMESQSSSPVSSALVPDVKEEKNSPPAFVEIRPVTSEIETPTFRPDVIIRSENLTVEIANTASEELLRKIRGLIHV
mgnify:CR=1 FL=1